MYKAVIAGFSRSPFTTARKGELIDIKPINLLAEVINNLVSKSKVNRNSIEDIVIGCAFQVGEQCFNIGKLVTFLTGMDIKTSGMTVDRWCGSSMEAIHIAAGKIAMGSGKVFICGGVESMTRVTVGFDPMPFPYLDTENPNVYFSMGITAENVAKKYNLTRKEQQEFAISSHQKAFNAQSKGNFDNEITTINNCSKDGNIRPKTNQEILDGLKLAFDQNGTITAATSSPLTDGAAATLICEEQFAKDNNLDILARIVSTSVEGCAPELMGLGPIEASKKALKRANLTIEDIDIVELNEAFASQSLACIKDLKIDKKKVNLDGGALALGHPLGATGARITGKAAELLRRENKKYALATQCIGLGMGIATVIESID
ncbi:thiolase family protein [Candidatus Pelagibacter sp.]|nr:thiolase family protein [Candidatus Pelagibacter sp.]|tara:strand:- start:108 stop:1232 length:1125 start_codon:yes stop_codon:yes gene_type:complete